MTVPTMYWLPKLQKTPYKSRFVSASSKCRATDDVSIQLTSVLTTIKKFFVNFCNKCYENSSIYFWSVKIIRCIDKLKSVQVPFSTTDSYDLSTL